MLLVRPKQVLQSGVRPCSRPRAFPSHTKDGLRRMNILVTGASGFIGRHLVRRLISEGHSVTVLIRNDCDLPSGVKKVFGRIENLDQFYGKQDVIYNLAAVLLGGSELDKAAMIKTHIVGTMTVVNLAIGWGARLIQVGTCYEYASHEFAVTEGSDVRPIGDYATSKFVASMLVIGMHLSGKLDSTVVRLSQIYGPGQRPGFLIPTMIESTKIGKPMLIPEDIRDYLYIEDAIDAMIKLATVKDLSVVNVGSGSPTRLTEIAAKIARYLGKRGSSTGVRRPSEVGPLWMNNDLAKERLGWSPATDLDAGLLQTIEFYGRG